MYAVLRNGGKQYKIQPGDRFRVEKLDFEKGSEVELEGVLFLSRDQKEPSQKGANEKDKPSVSETKKTYIGQPFVLGAKVKVKVLNHDRAKKILVFKKKRRQGFRKTQGHRQAFTELLVESIQTPEGEVFKAPPQDRNQKNRVKNKPRLKKKVDLKQKVNTTRKASTADIEAKDMLKTGDGVKKALEKIKVD